MQLVLEVDENYSKKFIDFLKTLNYIDIKDIVKEKKEKQDFLKFSGLWKDREIDVSKLREKAWKK